MPQIPRYHILPEGNVGELIRVLQSMEKAGMVETSSKIRAWDATLQEFYNITGLLIHPNGIIEIQTDEP